MNSMDASRLNANFITKVTHGIFFITLILNSFDIQQNQYSYTNQKEAL